MLPGPGQVSRRHPGTPPPRPSASFASASCPCPRLRAVCGTDPTVPTPPPPAAWWPRPHLQSRPRLLLALDGPPGKPGTPEPGWDRLAQGSERSRGWALARSMTRDWWLAPAGASAALSPSPCRVVPRSSAHPEGPAPGSAQSVPKWLSSRGLKARLPAPVPGRSLAQPPAIGSRPCLPGEPPSARSGLTLCWTLPGPFLPPAPAPSPSSEVLQPLGLSILGAQGGMAGAGAVPLDWPPFSLAATAPGRVPLNPADPRCPPTGPRTLPEPQLPYPHGGARGAGLGVARWLSWARPVLVSVPEDTGGIWGLLQEGKLRLISVASDLGLPAHRCCRLVQGTRRVERESAPLRGDAAPPAAPLLSCPPLLASLAFPPSFLPVPAPPLSPVNSRRC